MADVIQLALFATCLNLVTCAICALFLVMCLHVYARLDTHLVQYDDDFIEIYVKVNDITIDFIWFLMQAVGILICIRAAMGVIKEKLHLLAQFIIWKAIEMGSFIVNLSFEVDQHYENSEEASLGLLRFCYPLSMLVYDAVILMLVFLLYRKLPQYDGTYTEEDA